MRIGELAALAGVSTRAVRHYHHLGLLPEPERRANGYRRYRLRDAVSLARIRRLSELGLALDEIRDVLADDRGRDLQEVLRELDADLARQQDAITARRARLKSLIDQADLHVDETLSPEMGAVLNALPAGSSAFAELDREMLQLVYTAAGDTDRTRLVELFSPLTEPEAVRRGHDLYVRLDALNDASPDDPRVEQIAIDIKDHLPEGLATVMRDTSGSDFRRMDALFTDVPPAQKAVFQRLMALLKEQT